MALLASSAALEYIYFMRACHRTQRLGFLRLVSRFILWVAAAVSLSMSASAQISQAWVARYDNGITNGTVVIQASGFPGEMFDIEASTNLQTWLDLGTVIADTNGLMQFDDTNAVDFPFRFYYTNPK